MQNLNEKLKEVRAEQELRNREHEQAHKRWEREYRERQRLFNVQVRPHLRRAKPKDYRAWLEGWVEAGGEISHYYDYSLPSDFYVATSDLKLPPLYGASSISVIVPPGITITFEEGLGHSNLYFMDGFDHEGYCVPAYSNL